MSARLLLALALLAALRSEAGAEVPVRRAALVVGANRAPPDRQPLRYAYRDAETVGRTLLAAGGFEREGVQVLLDPSPEALLARLATQVAALKAAPGGETLLLFYYSGHADEQALYPGGVALPLERLRAVLDDPAITVRVGLLDACRGGGWTRSKGLTEAPPFEVTPLSLGLSSEGSAFIASSSGLEDAHESERLKGSFFTHHFVAGLLGAADQSADGEVSLTEAFEYARGLSVRDTARLAETPQHPSFAVRLRGRQDLVLTRLAPSSPGLVDLEQSEGPLELLRLPGATALLETPVGPRTVRVQLPPGRYLVRRTVGRAVYLAELGVEGGGVQRLRERDLPRVRPELVASKSVLLAPSAPELDATTVAGGAFEARVAVGVRYRDFGYSGLGLTAGVDRSLALITSPVWGITDRFQWMVGTLGFAGRLGRAGGLEWVPWGGVISLGLRRSDGGTTFSYGLGAGLDARVGVAAAQSVVLGLGAYSDGSVGALAHSPTTWRVRASAGWGITFRRTVTLHLAAALDGNALASGHLPAAAASGPELDLTLRLGSIQALGLRPLPLVQVHLTRWFSLDAYAGLAVKPRDGNLEEFYMLGASVVVY